MAGLLTARVLADGFREVTVIDRDTFPAEPVTRRGVPQGGHVHLLLEAGRATLEDLFPGYGEDLITAGGLVIDESRDVMQYEEGNFLADGLERSPIYFATRPLFEQVVRRRVAELDGSRCDRVVSGPTTSSTRRVRPWKEWRFSRREEVRRNSRLIWSSTPPAGLPGRRPG